MIEEYIDGVRKVTLGEGTTHISLIHVDKDTKSSGICFSSNLSLTSKGEFNGDEVIIEITNFQGAMSYIKPIIELLKTWEIEGMEGMYENLLRDIDVMTKK